MRALVRYKQLEYKKAEATMSEGATSGTTEMKKPEVTAIDYEGITESICTTAVSGCCSIYTS